MLDNLPTDFESEQGKCLFGDCLKRLKEFPDNSIDSVITDPPYAIRFMNKKWDYQLPSVETWREIYRVAKPGAILLSFGGPRTFHRLTCNIEDAGWEIKDVMMWVYGSGFPKSLDISKAIDKAASANREVVGLRSDASKLNKSVQDAPGGWHTARREPYITAPATESAKLWDGWGTALKPAWEPIIMAMKALDGTYAENAQKYGVAGLNIDECRVPTEDNLNGGAYAKNPTEREQLWGEDAGNSWKRGGAGEYRQPSGRYPANLIHDGSNEVVELFIKSDDNYKNSPARFFYCAKSSRKEKGEFNNHPTVKPLSLMEYLCTLTKTPTGGIVLDPFTGSGTTLLACRNVGRPFIGIENDENSFKIAVLRLSEEERKNK